MSGVYPPAGKSMYCTLHASTATLIPAASSYDLWHCTGVQEVLQNHQAAKLICFYNVVAELRKGNLPLP